MTSPWGEPTDAAIAAVLGGRGKPSPLAAYIPQLRAAAAKAGVPIAIVLAVLNQESGFGTDDNALTRGYNYWGLTGKGSKGSTRICHQTPTGQKCWDFALFGSVQEGIDAAISNMGGTGYQGLTLWQFFARYLTGQTSGLDDGAGNTVASYVANALAIIAKLGGSATRDTIVNPGGGTGGVKEPWPAAGGGSESGGSSGTPIAEPTGIIDDALAGLGITLPTAEEVRRAAIVSTTVIIGVALVLIGVNGLANDNRAASAAKAAVVGAARAGAGAVAGAVGG